MVMNNYIKTIKFSFVSMFKIHKNCNSCKKMNLKFFKNIYGDEINRLNCRSLWSDDFGNLHRCSTLYKNV